ncbi:cuticle protein 16.5-like [Dendroctonus ponderosae]
MAFKFAVAALALVAVVSLSTAAPNCGCGGRQAYSLPSLTLGGGCNLPFKAPSSYQCHEPAPSVSHKPDVHLPIPVPARIPLGNYCSCQKYSARPTLVPCARGSASSQAAAPGTTVTITEADAAPAPASNVVYSVAAPAACSSSVSYVQAQAPSVSYVQAAAPSVSYVQAPASPVSYVQAPAASSSVSYVQAPAAAAAPASSVNTLANLRSLLSSIPQASAPAAAPASCYCA